MRIKLISLVSFILVLTLAYTAYGIKLGDFENSMDGWSRVDPNDPNISTDYSTNGATLNQNSLKIISVSGWNQTISYNLMEQNLVDEFRKNLKISADVTRLTSDWTEVEGAYCDFLLAVQAGSAGDPNEPNDPNEWDLWYQPSETGNWLPDKGDDPMSVTYDYSLALNQIDFDNIEYLNLIFIINWGVFNPGGIYYLDNVQMFGGGPAYAPNPTDGEVSVPRDIILTWTPGVYADKHDVYFGTNFDDVNDADTSDTTGIYRDRWDANTYDPPGFLKSATTYYWRIDEVNGPDIWKGDVWSFTTKYPGAGIILGDWEQKMDGWEAGTQGSPTFDYNDTIGVTLNKYSLTVTTGSGYWTFRRPGLVDLSNMTLFLDVTMIADEWSGQWTKVDKLAISSDLDPDWREFNPTAIDRTTGASAPLDWGDWQGDAYKTYSWDFTGPTVAGQSYNDWTNATQMTINIALQTNNPTNPGPFHLDNARLVDLRLASNPDPADYATDAKREPTLSWKPGSKAATHDVYFGTSKTKVNDANRANSLGVLAIQNHDANTYEPGTLAFDKNYYWRIDEVNGPDIWKGEVWVFTICQYLVVDDFEDYNDFTPYKIFQTWKDGQGYTQPVPGYPGNGTGSAVGGNAEPWAEQSIVHGGSQSMPVKYVNDGSTGKALYSEIFRQWDTPQDWTTENVEALALWFRGYPATTGSYTNDAGTFTVTAGGWDIFGRADDFHFVYKELTGDATITARVVRIDDTAQWAKAGVMIRDNLDADSSNAFVCVTPRGRRSIQYRAEYKGDSQESLSEEGQIATPYWVRLTREYGSAFAAYYSTDGENWEYELAQDAVIMTDPVYIGLAYTSFAPGTLGQAVFSNVSIDGAVSGDWQSEDVPNNDAEQLYVVIEDVTDANTIVKHPDPNAVLLDKWTPWLIYLQDIANAGMDLENIKRMYIGVGDRDNSVTGGKGKLYIDDIRLLIPKCPAGDLNDDCMVDYLDLEAMADDWLGTGADLTADLDGNEAIDFIDYALLTESWLGKEILLP